MKFYKKDYLSIIEASQDKNMYACSIVLLSGEEILAYVKEIDDGVFYLQDPLRLVRTMDRETGAPSFMFKRFNAMTDDTTMILKESSIVTIGYMADAFIDHYKEAIKTIDKQMKAANKQLLNEESEDIVDDSWSQYMKDRPKLLN